MEYLKELEKLDLFIDSKETNIEQKDDLQQNNNICQNCNSENIINNTNTSSIICNNCGYIQKQIIDSSQEWRFFGSSDTKNVNPERCGMTIDPLLPKSSLGTIISGNSSNFSAIKRFHYWSSMPSEERSLFIVFNRIDEMLGDMINKKIKNQIKMYYKTLSEKDNINGYLTRGSVRNAFLAACIYISCKNNNKPLSKSEVASLCNIKVTELTRGLKKFADLEKNKNIILNKYKEDNIHNYINKYCNDLNLDENYIKVIHNIYIRSNKIKIIQNSNNISICGGLIYFIIKVFKIKIKKKILIEKIGISEVTMNKIYKTFLIHKKILFIGYDKIDFLKDKI